VGGSCGASPDGLVAAPQRILRLTTTQIANTVRYLINDEEAQAIIAQGSELGLPTDDTARHFPPATSEGESSFVHDGNVLRLDDLARHVGGYVTGHFAALTSCPPTDDCAAAYLARLASRAYRREATADEQKHLSDLYGVLRRQTVAGREVTTSVEEATGYAVWALFMSPQLVWRWEVGAQPTSTAPSGLTDDELASLVAFFLTDSPPDEMLLAAARAGTLRTNLASHVSRILQTPASRTWLREVMRLYFVLNYVALSPADPTKFPVDDALLASMAKGASLFLDDVLWNGGLGDLLLSRTGYVDARLAEIIYGIPAPVGAAPTDFVKVSLPADQRAGILTNPGFLAALSRADGQNLGNRAKLVGAIFFCSVPPPHPEVSFPTTFLAHFNEQTGQEQAAARAAGDDCKACHPSWDAYGLPLERYDAVGRYRTTYDYLGGKAIDGTGILPAEVGGQTVHDAIELAQVLATGPSFTECIAGAMLQYALTDLSTVVTVPSSRGPGACAVADVVERYRKGPQTFSGMVSAVASSSTFTARKAAP